MGAMVDLSHRIMLVLQKQMGEHLPQQSRLPPTISHSKAKTLMSSYPVLLWSHATEHFNRQFESEVDTRTILNDAVMNLTSSGWWTRVEVVMTAPAQR